LALHENRVRRDKDFQYLVEDISQSQQLRQKNLISLNEADRRKERDAQEKRLAARGDVARQGAVKALEDDGLQANERNLAKELAAEKSNKSAKDVLLNEAINVLGDEVALQRNNYKLAAGLMSENPVLVMELTPHN
jgi:carboxyl-terminal processing protease